MNEIIDLRSDTVTKPSIQMKEFMLNCDLGDDVYGEDPTVNLLEEKMAILTGKEAALFVTSGTQANLLALLTHCQRGDEYICGQEAHLYKYEAGGASVLGGIQAQPILYENDGSLDLNTIKNVIKPDDSHFARSKLLCLENTHDGKVLPLSYLKQAQEFANENNLLLHLDGARVFNASVSLGIEVIEICKYFDTVSLCLSKGLGAPVGSVLVGSFSFIQEARRYRKMLGGGLRQSGILAAAGLYCIKNTITDLQKDHLNAKILFEGLGLIKEIEVLSCDTNMLFIEVAKEQEQRLLDYLKEHNILISGYGQLRLVTHRDVTQSDIRIVIDVFKKFFNA
ncbi:MAG: low-specificity L-threonine aldolase [Campylobacteraceae bacterium]|nr:low-specificity L-threonine aldolase [Campylobacteraceae bacterium]